MNAFVIVFAIIGMAHTLKVIIRWEPKTITRLGHDVLRLQDEYKDIANIDCKITPKNRTMANETFTLAELKEAMELATQGGIMYDGECSYYECDYTETQIIQYIIEARTDRKSGD
jgi:hypothetical protein